MTINLYNPFNLVYISFQSVPIIVYFMWSDLYRTWRILFYNSAKLPPGFHSAINFQRFRETFLNIQRLYQFILTYNQLHHRTTSNHMVYLSTIRIRYIFSNFISFLETKMPGSKTAKYFVAHSSPSQLVS